MSVSPFSTREGRLNALIGTIVFLVAMSVYAYCVTPTVPYWDSGEYIATSYILGVPHPPGTPLYVLIGRLFSLIPIATIAVRVNLLSGLSSAVAVLFTYLIIVRLIRRNLPGATWTAWMGGFVGAMFMAFSPTFWDNAIEAEVYGSASTIMTLCVWLGLYWWERQGEARNDRILWLILYILFLAIGIHLGTFLVFPCIYLLVTMEHWDRVKKGGFWGSIALFAIVTLIRFSIISSINDADPRITELSLAPKNVQDVQSGLTLLLLAAVVWNLISVLGMRFTVGIVGLAVLGVSVHLYLLIRAGLDPAINEGDPHTWEALKLLLARDQYKPPEPIFRKAPFLYQLDYMYLRYFRWQFHLADLFGGRTYLLPIALGIFGAMMNFFREKKSFFTMLSLFLITGPFLVWYLNFRQGEVRERDYFFVANFHFFAIWIGMGAAFLVQAVSDALNRTEDSPKLNPVALPVALALVFMSTMPLWAGEGNNNFFRHNRRGNFVAHDYAYNMLVGLEKDAIIFTNGDNDTFPLWYIQEVEGFRKDVRVLCLSLMNTDWCIKQARDYVPKVPINLSDDEIDRLQPYRDKNGKVWLVKDIIVRHIIEANQWKRPVYLAVTVPEQMGFERQLSMEGLVYRILPEPPERRLNVAKTRDNLHNKYLYRGFLTEAGEWDYSVYKDDQSTKLLQNYAAAYVQLALELYDQGRADEALAEMALAKKISPSFPGVVLALGLVYERLGQYADAKQHYVEALEANPDQIQILAQLGHVNVLLGDTTAALAALDRSITLDPSGDFNPYVDLIGIHLQRGHIDECIRLLRTWLSYHPDDERARSSLRMLERPAEDTVTTP